MPVSVLHPAFIGGRLNGRTGVTEGLGPVAYSILAGLSETQSRSAALAARIAKQAGFAVSSATVAKHLPGLVQLGLVTALVPPGGKRSRYLRTPLIDWDAIALHTGAIELQSRRTAKYTNESIAYRHLCLSRAWADNGGTGEVPFVVIDTWTCVDIHGNPVPFDRAIAQIPALAAQSLQHLRSRGVHSA